MSALVSVIIPAYNAASTIRSTLDSVCRQTWDDLEVILVDDGSTDGSADIAEAYGDEKLTVIRTHNGGACRARNLGIRAAKGDYYQFIDADDQLKANKIELQMNALTTSDDHRAVAYGPWWEFFAGLENLKSGFSEGRTFQNSMEWLFASLQEGFYLPPHCWLVPACVVQSAGAWDERLMQNQDGEYFSRILQSASSAIWVADAVAYYRSGQADSISSRTGREYTESLLLAANLICSRMLSYAGEHSARRMIPSVLYLRILYRTAPSDYQMIKQIWDEIDKLGLPSRAVPMGGGRFNLMKMFLGWRLAFKAKHYRSVHL
jgi:glycosyltransferase involved in cell wall biosynthesis